MKPNHFIDHEEDYKLFIDTFISKVGKKAPKQFMRALTNPKNEFWEKLIFPNLVYDGCTGNPDPRIYIPVSNSAYTKGRNHLLADRFSSRDMGIPQGNAHLFANSLAVGEQDEDGNWETPSLRSIGSRYTYITIEFDPDGAWSTKQKRDFLDLQFGWFRIKTSNYLDCPIGIVHKHFSGKYSDYRGITACYSGNKSVHIHLIFDTDDFFRNHKDSRFNARNGYKEIHEKVRTTAEKLLNVKIPSDSSLERWEQYRKLPNGVLTVSGGRHILGVPDGTDVPLLTLWEKILTRAGRGAKTSLFSESIFYSSSADTESKSHRLSRKSSIGKMSKEEFNYCSKQFNSIIGKAVGKGRWPRGAGLEYQSCQYTGLLYACEGDVTPSITIFENSSKQFRRGGKLPDMDVDLRAPLSYFISKWREEFAKQNGNDKSLSEDANGDAALTTEEQDFKDNAVDIESARRILGDTVKSALACKEPSVILAPEGCGKTTCAMKEYPQAIESLAEAAWNELESRYTRGYLSGDSMECLQNDLEKFIEKSLECYIEEYSEELSEEYLVSYFRKYLQIYLRAYLGGDLMNFSEGKAKKLARKEIGEFLKDNLLDKRMEEGMKIGRILFMRDSKGSLMEDSKRHSENKSWKISGKYLGDHVVDYLGKNIVEHMGSHIEEYLRDHVEKFIREHLKKKKEQIPHHEKRLAKRANGAFAFGTYEAANEKKKEFNKMYGASKTKSSTPKYKAYVLKSFSKEYMKVCSLVGARCLNLEYAARHKHKSLISAIQALQPKVWKKMKNRHLKFHTNIKGTNPVWFIVQQALHLWHQDGITSIYWHPDFFTAGYKDHWKLKQEMELQLVIQDEIRVDQLTSLAPSIDVDWYRDMREDYDCWKSSNNNISDQFIAYCDYKKSHSTGMSFQEVFNIHKAEYTESDLITIRALEKYGSNTSTCIYSEVINNKWYAKIQYWMFGVATKTLIFTTELLPTSMLGQIKYEGQAINIQRLHSHHLVCDNVEATLLMKCKSGDTVTVVEDIREEFGNDIAIISNHSYDIDNVVTHASAKGSNRFSGMDVAQIIHYKSPKEYEALQLINALFDLNSAVLLSHVDEWNQTAGRIYGFRQDNENPNKGYMFCSFSLWALIKDILRSHGRYKITVIETAVSRKDRKRNKDQKRTDDAKKGDEEMREIAMDYGPDGVYVAEAYRSTIKQSFMEQIIEGHKEMAEIAREYGSYTRPPVNDAIHQSHLAGG